MSAGRLMPLPDQEPAPLVLVQVKLLDGCRLGSLAIGRFDRADMFAFAAHDDDAPASQFGSDAFRFVWSFHVASMLHGAAATDWQPLKILGKTCNMRDMKMGACGCQKDARKTDEIRIFRISDGPEFSLD